MGKNRHLNKHIVTFFVFAFLISWILWLFPLLNSNGVTMPSILMLLGQFAIFGPLIAACILLAAWGGGQEVKALFKNAWNWRFKKIWLLAILGLPFAMIGFALLLKIIFVGGEFQWGIAPASMPVMVIMILFTGGPIEEFGWRGYVLPRLLKRFPMLWASLILGVLHGLWHLPLHFMEGTVQSAIPIWEFVGVTAVGAIIYTWLYIKTHGSLTAMILHHWAGNVACAIFVYWDTAVGRYIFFGIQLLVAIVIVVTQRKHQLRQDEEQEITEVKASLP